MKKLQSTFKSYRVLSSSDLSKIKGGYSSTITNIDCEQFPCASVDDCPLVCNQCDPNTFRCKLIE